jgi:putative transposase
MSAMQPEPKTYYTAKELASLPGMPGTERAVQMKADRENWPSQKRSGRGGGKEYPMASLPIETRNHLIDAMIDSHPETICALPAARTTTLPAERIEPQLPDATTLKKWQRDCMDARLAILRMVEQTATTIGVSKAIKAIVQKAADGTLPEPFAKIIPQANARQGSAGSRSLSEPTVMRWWSTWIKADKKSSALAPRDPQRNDLPEWAPAFLAAYRVPQKISVQDAIDNMQLSPGMAIPSLSQAYRFIEKYSKLDIQRGRKSNKELRGQKSYCDRDTDKFNPCDICLCDGHSFKAYIAHPGHGRPFHPEVCAVVDAITRTVIGWSAGLAESAQTVADAIRHAVTVTETKPEGCIPAILYTDQGAGNKAEINAAEFTGLFARLGITFKTGIPGNSQARGRVERIQSSLWIKAAKQLPTYTGKNMDTLVRRNVYLQLDKDVRAAKKNGDRVNSELLITWPQFLDYCQEAVDQYNRTPHKSLPKLRDPNTGLMRHMCPLEMWSKYLAAGWQPTLPDTDELALLFRPQIQAKTRRGLVTIYGNTYHHKDLEHYHGETLYVAYDIHDATQVWVRDQQERLIAIAKFEGNKRDFYAVPVVQQAVEQRRQRRLKTAMNRIDEIEAEAQTVLDAQRPEHIDLPAEIQDRTTQILQLAQKKQARKLVGNAIERYDDIMERAKTGDVTAYELQWAKDYDVFCSTGKKTGHYKADEYCTSGDDHQADQARNQ